MMSEKKNFRPFDISDRESCEKAIKNGGWAAMISALLTGGFASIGLFTTPESQELAAVADPLAFIDAALILILGIFTFRKSRLASTLMVLYFAASKVYLWTSIGRPAGLGMAVLFFIFYFNAMRGTFFWHRNYASEMEVLGHPS